MSEFTCADCGDPMLHGRCTSCGGTRVGTMDGKSEAEIEAIEADNDYQETQDMRREQHYNEVEDEDYHKELDGYQP